MDSKTSVIFEFLIILHHVMLFNLIFLCYIVLCNLIIVYHLILFHLIVLQFILQNTRSCTILDDTALHDTASPLRFVDILFYFIFNVVLYIL